MAWAEEELLGAVVAEADSLGLLWHHCRDSRACGGQAGFPDLLIAGSHGILIPELKSGDGETSPGQDLWLWTLSQAWAAMWSPGIYRDASGPALWRPADWITGAARARLETIT